jgi:hypothetical protein
MTKTPHSNWAVSKVDALSPNSIEKITLLAIAMISEPDGSGCYAKVSTIARKIGRSERMVQDHIRALKSRCTLPRIGNEDDGSDQANAELRVAYQASKYRTNKYFINVCRQSNISKSQLKLPLKTKLPLSSETTESMLRSGHAAASEESHRGTINEMSEETRNLFESAMKNIERSMSMESERDPLMAVISSWVSV